MLAAWAIAGLAVRDFPWARVPDYIVIQLIGATLAALVLHAIINVSATYGSNYPAHGYFSMAASPDGLGASRPRRSHARTPTCSIRSCAGYR